MANGIQKKQDDGKEGLNTMTAAVTGAVIGAGIAIAGAVALKEENRQKMKDAISNTKGRAENYIEDLRKRAQDRKELLKDELAEGKDEVVRATTAAKDSLRSSQNNKV